MEDDKGSGVVDWISCTNCMMWVHKICAGNATNVNIVIKEKSKHVSPSDTLSYTNVEHVTW